MLEVILNVFFAIILILMCYLIFYMFICGKSRAFTPYKYPFPPPCKLNNHDYVPNGYDIDSDYFKCRKCGQEKRENFKENRL